ncbi:MAG TPA: rhomboid family intramembrane serine protease [Chloroflexota bacterium]|nr:rhomboid family intramembrane serine protease [Chloroflexota bacterium]
MIPLKDEPRARRPPMVTVALLLLNILVFVYELALGPQLEGFIRAYGAIPLEIVTGRDLVPRAPLGSPYLTLVTSMFLHAGLLHLGFNMLYLWIFGDNVEDAFGHLGYLLFYFACGLGAHVAQIAVAPMSTVPSIGASGAIAGVLGAYLVLFPSAQVRTLLFLGPIILLPRIPALLLIGFWFVTQLVAGLGQLGVPAETGGVAFWAHIGGFVVGVALTLLFRPQPARPATRWPGADW